MSPELAAAVLLGIGLFLLIDAVPLAKPRPSLERELQRFDVDLRVAERTPGASTERPLLPWPSVDAVVRPLVEDVVGPLQRVLVGAGSFGADLDRDLRLVRPDIDAGRFLGEQLLLAALAAATALAVALVANGRLDATVVVLTALAAIGGFVWPYAQLQAALRDRRRRIGAELPQVARLLALALSAGLGLEGALERVARRSAGVLGVELRRAQEQISAGHRRPMDALVALADRERVPEVIVMVHHLRAADEQGLPLAQALEALAVGVREQQAARLLEVAEKGTVKMLFPLALVMLPVTLVVALIPSLAAIRGLLGS